MDENNSNLKMGLIGMDISVRTKSKDSSSSGGGGDDDDGYKVTSISSTHAGLVSGTFIQQEEDSLPQTPPRNGALKLNNHTLVSTPNTATTLGTTTFDDDEHDDEHDDDDLSNVSDISSVAIFEKDDDDDDGPLIGDSPLIEFIKTVNDVIDQIEEEEEEESPFPKHSLTSTAYSPSLLPPLDTESCTNFPEEEKKKFLGDEEYMVPVSDFTKEKLLQVKVPLTTTTATTTTTTSYRRLVSSRRRRELYRDTTTTTTTTTTTDRYVVGVVNDYCYGYLYR
eukprot:CAMPEP_0178914110 /NCGR_PEP_ID=MMETSP0786-20121207/11229_1 /TAXON_ID=186022 /ORGANISM="Thalassionema frauenfeldii, Strain CCMP 1798" /LENGTH=279 /DNA_ID=CAMNT_0020586953 /DNA_START=138 /DNA_END=977 /DNA_ORIENTATION=+